MLGCINKLKYKSVNVLIYYVLINLILYVHAQGTGGWWTWTDTNGRYVYLVPYSSNMLNYNRYSIGTGVG